MKIAFRKTVFLPDLFISCMEAAFQVDLFSEILRTVEIFTYTILKRCISPEFSRTKMEIFHVKHFNSMHRILDQ